MSNHASDRLQRLQNLSSNAALQDDRMGLEKEALRLSSAGAPAASPHPQALGSALCNPYLTTDFSENMLELVTPVARNSEELLSSVEALLYFAYRGLGNESLAPTSMPVACTPEQLPIAQYGSSHSGRLRHYYRQGLALRYGKQMQSIAGLHFNFSFGEQFVAAAQSLSPRLSDERAVDHVYFATIRNYQRYSWLILYLFGASPALDSSFSPADGNELLVPHGKRSLLAPYATSLRMSSIGYSNKYQKGINLCHNNLSEYLDELNAALQQEVPAYAQLGVRQPDGAYQQLNSKLLQIENEFYNSIRPKAPAVRGRRQLSILASDGIQYLELRNIDLNPFAQLGVTLEQVNFLRLFLYFCALVESPLFGRDSCTRCGSNNTKVSKYGLDAKLLLDDDGLERQPKVWAEQLLDEMAPIAAWLDAELPLSSHQRALAEQITKVQNSEKTPSAQVLHSLISNRQDHHDFALEWATRHREQILAKSVDTGAYAQAARKSILDARKLEQECRAEDFEHYLQNYLSMRNYQPD